MKGSDYSSKITRTYNKGGYPVSQESDDLTVTWKYTMDKKKNCPKQVIVSARQSGKTEKFKVVFTTFKKVSRIRNCDASGREILLVPDVFVFVNGMDF